MATTKLWTIDEVANLPDDDQRYALIRGELYRMSPPMPRHGRIAHTVGRHIGNHVADRNLGVVYDPCGFVLARDPDVLLEPDLAFVQRTRVPANENAFPELAPDLVVEVVSPSQTGPSIADKVELYRAAGVRLIWVVDPARRTVRIHREDGSERLLSENDEIDGEDVLPGFRLPLATIFV